MANNKNERTRILKIASDLFETRGYNNVTIRDIATQAGIGRGNLYYYFKKKEDMLHEHGSITCKKINWYIEHFIDSNLNWKIYFALQLELYDIICKNDDYVPQLLVDTYYSTDSILDNMVKSYYKYNLQYIENNPVLEKKLFLGMRISYLLYLDWLYYSHKNNQLIPERVQNAIKQGLYYLDVDSNEINKTLVSTNKLIELVNIENFMKIIYDKEYEKY